ncbi:hypothetical protein MOP88_02325 [Sphingomonas sp. WKB10]|nr:hypothetical protein [Sphingomonas sp. WKB10]
MSAAEVEIGANERRASQRLEDAALMRRLSRHDLLDHSACVRRLRAVIGKPTSERADKFTVCLERLNLETRDTPLGLT